MRPSMGRHVLNERRRSVVVCVVMMVLRPARGCEGMCGLIRSKVN